MRHFAVPVIPTIATHPRLGRRSGGGAAPSYIPTITTDTIVDGSVTYTLSAASPVGQDATGSWFYEDPTGTVTITAIGPAESLEASRVIHGATKNPVRGTHGWDSSLNGYSAGVKASFPLAMTPGDVVTKVVSRLGITQNRRGIFDQHSALYCVSGPQLTTACLGAAVHTGARTTTFADPAAIAAAIPTQTVTGAPTWAEVAAYVDRLDLGFGMLGGDAEDWGYQAAMPYRFGSTQASSTAYNYGEYVGVAMNALLQGIVNAAWSLADRTAAVKRLIRLGIEWDQAYTSAGASLGPDGGHYQLSQGPVLLSRRWRGQSTAPFFSNLMGNWKQPFRMTADRMRQLSAHTSLSWFSLSMTRTISAVTGTAGNPGTITFNATRVGLTGDPPNFELGGNRVYLKSDPTQIATITTHSAGFDGTTPITVSIVHPAGRAFAVNDQIAMTTGYTVEHGDMFWRVTDSDNRWVGSHQTAYIDQQGWSAPLVILYLLGFGEAGLREAVELLIRHNTTNEPAGHDFPAMDNDTFFTTADSARTWAASFYAANYTTAFASILTPDTTAPVVSNLQTPVVLDRSSASIVCDVDSAESGQFIVAYPDGGATPSAAQVLAGLNGSGVAAPSNKWSVTSAGTQPARQIDGLAASTAYRFAIVAQDWYGNTSAVQTSLAFTTLASGELLSETWAAPANFVAGNGFSDMALAGWSRSSSVIVPTIVSDVDGPGGLALRIGVTSAAFHFMGRSDMNTLLAARTTERVQVLSQFRLKNTTTTLRAGLGRQASSLNTGLRIARTGVNQNFIGIQVAGDVSTGTNLTSVASALTDGAVYWCRMEVDGVNIRARVWADGASEPGTWTTRTEGAAITFDNLSIIGRNANPCLDLLGFSLGIGLDAPAF